MSQATERIAAITGMLNGFERNGTLTDEQVSAVEDILDGDERPSVIIDSLTRLVRDNRRSIPAAAVAAFEAIVGTPTATDREVTITLRVSGNTMVALAGGQITAAVEQALAEPARRAGLTITRGSVNVTGA